MNSLPEALRFAWKETAKPDASIISRGIMFTGAVGRIAHMRTALLFEPEGYGQLPNKTEEKHIKRTIDGIGQVLGFHKPPTSA